MGILKAGAGALGGALAEQWLECFSCGAMGQGLLLTRGVKQIGENSANVKGEPNIISDGSVILVADGQCALAVEQGQVIGVYDTPGEHRFSSELTKRCMSASASSRKPIKNKHNRIIPHTNVQVLSCGVFFVFFTKRHIVVKAVLYYYPVKVVALMLYDLSGQTGEFPFACGKAFIEITYSDVFISLHLTHSDKRETAFLCFVFSCF